MRKLIVTTLVLLGFDGLALGQHRIIKLNSSQVQGQEPKADSITVVWDDGEGRQRWSSVSIQGPVNLVTRDIPQMSPYSPVRYLTRDGEYREIHYLTLSRVTVTPYWAIRLVLYWQVPHRSTTQEILAWI